MQYKCLSIAGFDGSGGAGLQADLKTFSALGCYGMTVLTALPIQNTCGVKNCYAIPVAIVEQQLHTLFEDIIPESIKIGMLFSAEIIHCVANFLKTYAKNIPIVLDPVMFAKSGDRLLNPDAIHTLKTELIPLATLLTPNLPEAAYLTDLAEEDELLPQKLLTLGAKAVLLKGGHAQSIQSNDVFLMPEKLPIWLYAERIPSKNTHGTGCTLAAAISAFLALGHSPLAACRYAKNYLSGAIKASQYQSVGKGHGPVHHFYHLWPHLKEFIQE